MCFLLLCAQIILNLHRLIHFFQSILLVVIIIVFAFSDRRNVVDRRAVDRDRRRRAFLFPPSELSAEDVLRSARRSRRGDRRLVGHRQRISSTTARRSSGLRDDSRAKSTTARRVSKGFQCGTEQTFVLLVRRRQRTVQHVAEGNRTRLRVPRQSSGEHFNQQRRYFLREDDRRDVG